VIVTLHTAYDALDTWFVLVLCVCCAIFASIHALLTKPDPRSAFSWIVLCWLFPLGGPIFYGLFGINRVTRRGLKLHRLHEKQANPPDAVEPKAQTHIALLSQVSARVTQSPLTGGNAFTVLQGGDEAYPQMLAAIGAAKHCIAMSSYIFRNDAAGQEFVNALIDARRRGVAVRVLLDSVGSGYIHAGAFDRLLATGIGPENCRDSCFDRHGHILATPLFHVRFRPRVRGAD